jgi:ATP-binding cassette subfamily D (ALD) protein 4
MSQTTFVSERTSLIQQQNSFHVKSKSSKYSLDLLFVRRLQKIVQIISQPKVIKIMLVLLFFATLAHVYVVSFTGQVIGGFYQVITSKDIRDFYKILAVSIVIISGSALLDSTIKFLTDFLAVKWREKLCLYLHECYFRKRTYYKVQHVECSSCDNPDQRITQDADNFTTSLAQICSTCLSAPLIIVLYAFFSFRSIAWYAPVIVLVYFLVGFSLNRLVMVPIVNIVYRQEQLEGDFRYVHMRVRENAESIALYRGDKIEHQIANNKFRPLIDNKTKLIRWFWTINSTSNILSYLGSVLNYSVVALPVILGQKENPTSQYVAEASFQLIMLIQGFSTFANLSKAFSELAGYTSRIAHFIEQMEFLQNETDRHFNGKFLRLPVSADHDEVIRFTNVTCFTPQGRSLVHNLNFVVRKGKNLLIIGPSGCGKSTILRILNELWNSFSGIERR